ncbi:MAG: hypothetical protein V3U75_00525 [Methylococcaceae bacterium]
MAFSPTTMCAIPIIATCAIFWMSPWLAIRLYDGYEKVHSGTDKALGLERIQQGITSALFHDIGYIKAQ